MFSKRITAILLATVATSPTALWAQTGDAQQPTETTQAPASGNDYPPGDIVVTALRRATNLEQTPAAITSLSGEAIRQNNIANLVDLQELVPGLVVTSGGAGLNTISLRGVRTGGGDQLVGLYYDETPLNAPPGTTTSQAAAQSGVDFFDVSRVEVLRGPQGTLYGASAAGGAIRLITNKPDLDHFSGTIDLSGSTTSHSVEGYQANGEINIPLIEDKLAVRIVAYRRYTPGYIDNAKLGLSNVNSDTATGGRVLVRYQPVSNVTLDFSAHLAYENSNGSPTWAPGLGLYQSADQVYLWFRDKNRFYNFTGNIDLGFAKLTGTTSYQDRDLLQTRDPNPLWTGALHLPAADLPGLYYQPQSVTDLTSEIRLSSEGKGPFTWTVGGYYEDRRSHVLSLSVKVDPDGFYNPASDPTLFGRHVLNDITQKAVFGELAYTFFHNLTITGGIRYYNYDITVGGDTYYSVIPQLGSVLPYSLTSSNASGLLYKANLSWQADRHLLFYFNAASGYRPGGVNQVIGYTGNLPYKPDSLWTYEAGGKATYLDGRAQLNAALYRTDWTDMQVNLNSGSYSYIGNAGSARIQGLEAELHLEPIKGWTFDTTVTTLSAKLTSDQVQAGVVAAGSTGRAGNRIPLVPEFTAELASSYEWGIGHELKAVLHGSLNYTGASYSAFNPGTNAAVAGYYRVGDFFNTNARVGVKDPSWSAYVFASNIFNSKGKISAANTLGGTTETILTLQPRTIGINLSKSF